MTTPPQPSRTWIIVGYRLAPSEVARQAAGEDRPHALELVRGTIVQAAQAFGVVGAIPALDERIERGEVQWHQVEVDGETFRFAALTLPVLLDQRGKGLRAILAAMTSRYRHGQPALARAAGLVLQDILAPEDPSAVWVGEHGALEHGPFPKFWMIYWAAAHTVPWTPPQRVATLGALLTHRYPQGWREPTDED